MAADRCLRSLFKRYKTPRSIAKTPPEHLRKILKPLGLYRLRAIAIKHVAASIIGKYKGQVPRDYASLVSLPHVGRYSANATLCFGYGQRRPIVDSNIVRLFNRYFGTRKPVEVHKAEALWRLATEVLPKRNTKRFNWKMLDLARNICMVKKPNCKKCVLKIRCKYFVSHKEEISDSR